MPELSPELLSEAVAKGADLLECGVTDFAKWSRSMVYQFGDEIRPDRERIWMLAQDERQRRKTSAPPRISGNQPSPVSGQASSRRPHDLSKAVPLPVYSVLAGLVLVSASIWWHECRRQKTATDEEAALTDGT